MSDDQDSRDESEDGGGVTGAVGGIATGTGEALGGLGTILGEDESTAEAGEALETAGKITGAVGTGIQGASALAGGDAGGLGGLGGAVGGVTGALADVLPANEVTEGLREASKVANAVGEVARGIGEIVEAGEELMAALAGERHDVTAELEIQGENTHFTVTGIDLHERLDGYGSGHIIATYSQYESLDRRELLSKDVTVTIHRGDRVRHFRGIIRRANIGRVREEHELRLEVTPALWLLDETLDSRVYQDKTVPELVEQIVDELLAGKQRKVRIELTETYPTHEYLVQHRESHYAFIARLCNEEGIFFYFDHDDDDSEHEVLVLGDTNRNRPQLFEGDENVLHHDDNATTRRGREVAFHASSDHRVGATDAVVRGYDWSNPQLAVHHEATERGEFSGPPLEVYDHHHAVRHHGYDDGGGSYQQHDADRRSRMQSERLDLTRSHWSVSTTAIGAVPGKMFELQDADEHDGRYVIVSADCRAQLGRGSGDLQNTLQLVPIDTPYRPPVRERRFMPGPETARVVGPAGEEIHTDRYGRVKVQFHWDRRGENNERSSAWLRVSQSWAGAGWGTMFIPRIGMEVIVSFLGGDPDRPIVTGCLYNGDQGVPYTLPDRKTVSTIKTNSSKGGGGSNELRFEDDKGHEEVYIHAQKDFNEVVENNHSTHVKNNQSNTVDHDQTEHIKDNQTLTVDKDRKKTVKGSETTTITEDRIETVQRDETVNIHCNRTHAVGIDETCTVIGHRIHTVLRGEEIVVQRGQKVSVTGDRQTMVVGKDNLTIAGEHNIACGTHFSVTHGTAASLLLKSCIMGETTGSVVFRTPAALFGMDEAGNVTLEANQSIKIKCGLSSIELTSGQIKLKGPKIKIEATTGDVEVWAAAEVRLNSD